MACGIRIIVGAPRMSFRRPFPPERDRVRQPFSLKMILTQRREFGNAVRTGLRTEMMWHLGISASLDLWLDHFHNVDRLC